MQRVALEEGVVLLLLNALRDGLLIARGEVAGNGFPLLLGFGAFQGDDFLHSGEKVEGSEKRPPGACATAKFGGNPAVGRAASPFAAGHTKTLSSNQSGPGAERSPRPTVDRYPLPLIFLSVKGSITPRRKSVTWPVLEETTSEMHCVA